MKNKKAPVSGETKGLNKTSDKSNFNPNQNLRQEKQQSPETNKQQLKQRKSLSKITCYECKKYTELAGYRFRLVPLCACCRNNRETEVARNRFNRRKSDGTKV